MKSKNRGCGMPILMLALIALAVFGAIGVLLLAAEMSEHRKKSGPEKTLGAKS